MVSPRLRQLVKARRAQVLPREFTSHPTALAKREMLEQMHPARKGWLQSSGYVRTVSFLPVQKRGDAIGALINYASIAPTKAQFMNGFKLWLENYSAQMRKRE